MRRLLLATAMAAALALALAACGGGSSSTSTDPGETSTSTPSPAVPAELEAAVEKAAASGVPVRIPPALLESPPAGANHAEVLRSPADSYTLALAATPECRFKSDCVVAIFSGSAGGGALSGRKLALAAGIEGIYEPGRCGPGCRFGTVAWHQNGDTYGVGVPNASTPELVVLANEAIEGERPVR
jgi:hypothetical protein